MFGRRVLIALCVSTLAVAASGCGGGSGGTSSSGAKPDAWAANVCGGFNEWAQGMQADSQTIASGKRDVVSVKARFIVFLAKAVQRSDTLLSRVNAVGPPAVKNGAALQRDLEAVLRRARNSFARAVPTARALPTTDPATFARKVGELSQVVQRELTATGQTFKQLGTKYKDKSLNRATSNEPACQKSSSG